MVCMKLPRFVFYKFWVISKLSHICKTQCKEWNMASFNAIDQYYIFATSDI